MFFPENIRSIKPGDKVLEVGPGGTPYHRSDVFLELKYDDPNEFRRQRADEPELITSKPVVYYDGKKFPFADKEFDYIICSHVLEHVPDVEAFISEVTRVAKRGYMEYPTVYYDYVYNIPEHLNFLMRKNGTVYWMKKNETRLNDFKDIHHLFFQMLASHTSRFVNENERYFIQGFEWESEIRCQKTDKLSDLVFDREEITFKKAEVPAIQPGFKDKLKIKLKLIIDRI